MTNPPQGTLLLRTGERISYGISFAGVLLPGESLSAMDEPHCAVTSYAPALNRWGPDPGAITALSLTGGVDTATVTGGGGSGYSPTAPPVVTVDPPDPGGTLAVLTAVVGSAGAVTGLVVMNPGAGYPAAPSFTIAPPQSGTTATGTCTVRLDTITVHLDGAQAAVGQCRQVIVSADTTYAQTYKSDAYLFYTDE